jgi:hypothetical protein
MTFPPFTPQAASETAALLGPLPPASAPALLIFTGWKDDAARLRQYHAGHAVSLRSAALARANMRKAPLGYIDWRREHGRCLRLCREYRSEIARLTASRRAPLGNPGEARA